jgi:catalase
MLQGRLFSYPDTQRYRLGVNYNSLPINKAKNEVTNNYRNGTMRHDDNGGASTHYEPSHFASVAQTDNNNEPAFKIDGNADRFAYDTSLEADTAQAGTLYRLMEANEQADLVENIANAMAGVPEEIVRLQLSYFLAADKSYGERIAAHLGISL